MQISDFLGIQLFQLGTMWCWKDDRCLLADMQGFLYSPMYYNTAWPNQYRYFLGEQLPFYKFPITCLERNLYCPMSLPLFQMIKFSSNILVCILHRSLKSSYDFIKNPHIYIQKPVNCVGALVLPSIGWINLGMKKTQWPAVTTSDKNEWDIVLVFQLKKAR